MNIVLTGAAQMGQYIHFTQYSPSADVFVMAICIVMVILIFFSYFSRTISSRLFLGMVTLVFATAFLDVLFYKLAGIPKAWVPANWIRCGFHAGLLLILVYYIAYICEVSQYEKQRLFRMLANLILVVAIVADIIVTANGLTFIVDETGISFVRRGIFIYAYLAFIVLSIFLLTRVRKLLFHRIMYGFYGTIAVSFLLLIIQGVNNTSTYTVASLQLPVLAMMYVLHSNPYDIQLGTNDAKAMQDYVEFCRKRKKKFIVMSLYMREFEQEGKEMPSEMQNSIREFTYRCARKSRLFKVAKGHMILLFMKDQYPDCEKKIKEIIDAFVPVYEKYRYDFKVVIGNSNEEISAKNEYVRYIRSIHKSMPECSVHRVVSEDVAGFRRSEYILRELADINRKGDLNDPRVLVYCQPVLDE